MTWAKLDDGFWMHPKVVMAGNEAAGIFCRCLSWSSANGKTGRVPVDQALELAGNWNSLRRLVEHELAAIDHKDHVCLLGRGELWRGFGGAIGRVKLQRWLRRKVIDRDGHVCGLCGGQVTPDDIHIDHIMPVALGGRDTLENLQVAHSTCNIRKGARI